MVWYFMIYDIWYDMIWYGIICYGMIWYDMIWYDMICLVNKHIKHFIQFANAIDFEKL